MIPEGMIVSESFKRFHNEPDFDGRILLPQRCLQLLDEIAKPDRVLLILGMPPMGRLVQRETGRLMNRCQLGQ